jgi:hypothetical protein
VGGALLGKTRGFIHLLFVCLFVCLFGLVCFVFVFGVGAKGSKGRPVGSSMAQASGIAKQGSTG